MFIKKYVVSCLMSSIKMELKRQYFVSIIFYIKIHHYFQCYSLYRYYPSRMSGMELQVSTLALCGTNILMVLFYNRKRMPFKFKVKLENLLSVFRNNLENRLSKLYNISIIFLKCKYFTFK